MKDYILTDADLYEGAKLICLKADSSSFTAGKVYVVIGRRKSLHWPFRITNDSSYSVFDISELQTDSQWLAPYDLLGDKDKFIYELSGKLP